MNHSNCNVPDEFHCGNRQKNLQCSIHHHGHQHNAHLNQRHQQLYSVYKQSNPNCSGVNAHPNAGQSGSNHQRHHLHTDQFHFHNNQRFRSSVSPLQNYGTACGSNASTLNSSSGYGTSSTLSVPGPVSKIANRLCAADLIDILREKIAILPGGRSRTGGPILCFLSNSGADRVHLEDLCRLVSYLYWIPNASVRALGTSVIVDMRNGTTWQSVKPILKVLETCIAKNVTIAYIIKPDKFIEKHKAAMAVGKFSFQIQVVSREALFREVHPSQLTAELEGSLPYDHEEWIRIRCNLEQFFSSARDMWDKFDQLLQILKREIEPDTSEAARRTMEHHKSLETQIADTPISALEAEANRLVVWLRYGMSAVNTNPSSDRATSAGSSSIGGGGGASFVATSWVSMNPDFREFFPQVRQAVNKLYEHRAHLQSTLETNRSHIEEVYKLRLFEEDVTSQSCWLGRKRQMFLTVASDIGSSASQAADLSVQHRQFMEVCFSAYVCISRLKNVAGILADGGHFAGQEILKQSSQLEHEWKSFAAALEDRSHVLCLSERFHTRAQSFLANCSHRERAMNEVAHGITAATATAYELNQALANLQNYWQEAQSAHDEVCEDGRALTNHLSAPIPNGSHTSLTAAVDYSQGRKHCTDLVHKLWNWFKQLEGVYTDRKERLNNLLSCILFKEDVGHVLNWLSTHGHPFLKRHTSVGKSVTRAEQLYNTHMQFENVAAITLMNAEKLISAADEIATKSDYPDDILQRAFELRSRITSFTQSLKERRETVDLGCGFYKQIKQLLSLLQGLKEAHNAGEHLPATIEGMEDEVTQFHHNWNSIEKAVERVTSSGKCLIERLTDTDDRTHIESALTQMTREHGIICSLFKERQVRLDLCMQLRLFEADVNSTLDAMRNALPCLTTLVANRHEKCSNNIHPPPPPPAICISNPNHGWIPDPYRAPNIGVLEEVQSACTSVLPTAEEALNKGGELERAFDSLAVNFPAGGPGSSDSGVGDSVESAVERIHRLINELTDAVSVVDELNESVHTELEWRRLKVQCNEILDWIKKWDLVLRETSSIPTNLAEAQAMQTEHEKFQPVLNDAHPRVVNCTALANMLFQQQQQQQSSTSSLSKRIDVPNRSEYRLVSDAVAEHWRKLVYAAEERHKLLLSASNWYKISERVNCVLLSLEKEYHREEDWCQNEKALPDPATFLSDFSIRHAQQKEAFLKACMVSRRTSDMFCRYMNRQPQSQNRTEVDEGIRIAISDIMAKEQAVLEAWAVRRRRVDDCTYFINIKRQIEDLVKRVKKATLDAKMSLPQLASSTKMGASLAQEMRRARDTLQSMISSSMPDSPNHSKQLNVLLEQLHSMSVDKATGSSAVADVNNKVPKNVPRSELPPSVATKRLDQESDRTSVSSTSSSGAGSSITGTSEVFLSTNTSSSSICSSASASTATTSASTSEEQRIHRRRQHLLTELIHTERTYIQALEQCVDTYRQALVRVPLTLQLDIPPGLVGMVDAVFGNLPAICNFHKNIFEPELRKYTESGDFLPEDVGHCFVAHSERLAELYVCYCVNHTAATRLVIEHGQSFFLTIQHHLHLVEPLQSYLIKPIQRVTKYQLLLRELRDCCDPASVAELGEGLDAMLNVPKRANDAMHLSMLQGLPEDLSISSLGDVILQDAFTIWEPKQLIKKSRDRRIFLFDNCLILAKEVPTQLGEHKAKYHYKSFLLLADCNITEHIEGDQCKFALWTGHVPPPNEYRMVLKAGSLELKQNWVRALREMMSQRMLEESNMQNTFTVLEAYQAISAEELSVSAHQTVKVLYRCQSTQIPPIENESGPWAYVRCLVGGVVDEVKEGFIPMRLLGAAPTQRRPSTTSLFASGRRLSTSSRKRFSVDSNSRRVFPPMGAARLATKLDISPSQTVKKPYQTTTPRIVPMVAATESSLPMHYDTQPVPVTGESDANNPNADNISEESIEVELPPPMSELQVLQSATTINGSSISNQPKPPPSSPTVPLNEVDEESNGDGFVRQIEEKPILRPAVVSEVAGDGRVDASNVPALTGLPLGANLNSLGDLRLHGSLQVAAKLVAGSRPSANQLACGPDTQMLRSVLEDANELHFVTRYLLLYDLGLIIADAAMQPVDTSSGEPKLQCQFRHTLPISQISLLEDVGSPGSNPSTDQLRWFCISERSRFLANPSADDPNSSSACAFSTGASTTQSYLCYVVAPRSLDTRMQWLTELSAMVIEARRMSQLFNLTPSTPTTPCSPTSEGNSLLNSAVTSQSTPLSPNSAGTLFDPNIRCEIGQFPSSTSPTDRESSEPLADILENLHLTAHTVSST